jgi:sulfate/thiosulfate transport system substrate-binding protein
VDKHKTREVSEAFAKFLFTPEAQREFAKTGFRPVNGTVVNEFQNRFPKVANVYTIGSLGGWDTVQKKFFSDGAVFDRIQTARR